MEPYSIIDKSIKIPHDFQKKDKQLDSQELPLSSLQDLYWPSWFHKLTVLFLQSPTHLLLSVYGSSQNRIRYMFMCVCYVYEYMFVCVYVYVYIYKCVCIYIYVHVYVCIYIYIPILHFMYTIKIHKHV